MKRLFFISILFFLFMVSRLGAQAFPGGDAEWFIHEVYEVFDEPWEELFVTEMTSSDTVINEIHYNIITESVVYDDGYHFLLNTGFVRNEGDKVFLLNEEEMEEELLYDFGLEQGDVFDTWYYVLSVDSILVENNTYRKRWKLGTLDSMVPIVWIEGIGNKHSILKSTYSPDMIYHHIVCFKEEGEIIYSNPKESVINNILYDCNWLLSGVDDNETISKIELNISPNPADSYFNVSLYGDNSQRITSISIYDVMGNNIFNAEYEKQLTVNIGTTAWASGLYLVKINEQFIKKILIQ